MKIPEGVSFEINKDKDMLIAKGPKGEVKRKIIPFVKVELKDKDKGKGSEIEVKGNSKMYVNTMYAHIRNMIKGVTEGYKKKMKILYAHFPITVEIKGKDVIIKNFLGEKVPRKAKIFGNVKISVKGQEMILEGADIEEVGQTAANIMRAVKIKEKDPRIFQDGIYPIEE